MDVTFTNLSTAPVYIIGPNVELQVGGTAVWSGVSANDIENNYRIKELIDDGTISASMAPGTHDDALYEQTGNCGMIDRNSLTPYTSVQLALLNTYEGRVAFCTNGRKVGEGGGAGTGVPVYFSNAAWRVYSTDAAVTV